MNLKKITALLICVVMMASLAACGGGNNNSGGGSSTESTGGTEPAGGSDNTPPAATDVSDDVGEYLWSLGTDSSEDTVTHFYAVTLSQNLEALSGGKMKLDVFPNATLGGDVALLEGCNAGSVDFVVQTTAPQVNFVPELAVFDLPMVYPTIQEFRQVFDNESFMTEIAGYYEAAGYKLLGYADQTFRVMSSNKRIDTMGDFNGVIIRTMENPNHLAFWNSIGASPTPMAFSELYTGLQQGVVTAQENPYAVIYSNKLYEVQDYVVQTNHLPHILSLITNPALYNGLNDAERAILDEAVELATQSARAEADRFEAEKIQQIQDENTEIIPVSPELYAEMKAACQPVYDEIAAKVGQDLVNAYTGA